MRKIKFDREAVTHRIDYLIRASKKEFSYRIFSVSDVQKTISAMNEGAREAYFGVATSQEELIRKLLETELASRLVQEVIWDDKDHFREVVANL